MITEASKPLAALADAATGCASGDTDNPAVGSRKAAGGCQQQRAGGALPPSVLPSELRTCEEGGGEPSPLLTGTGISSASREHDEHHAFKYTSKD